MKVACDRSTLSSSADSLFRVWGNYSSNTKICFTRKLSFLVTVEE
jgi:hypothetical protein